MIEITPELIQTFRNDKKAFSDVTKWPDEIITDAFNEGIPETGSKRWGSFDQDNPQNYRRRGLFYYTAHWLASTYLKQDASDGSDVSPNARLNTSGKSVGDENIQYRITQMQATEDDWLSTTNYGVQYLRLRNRARRAGFCV